MKFTTAILSFALLAGRAIAQSQQPLARLPPGCLLHAVNTQDEPSDMTSVCGNNAKDVQEAIASMCKDNVVDQAQAAFIATCSSAGHSVAAYTASGNKSGGNTAVTTDSDGRVVTQTSSPGASETENAAPIVAQNAGTGYVAVVMVVVAIAAL